MCNENNRQKKERDQYFRRGTSLPKVNPFLSKFAVIRGLEKPWFSGIKKLTPNNTPATDLLLSQCPVSPYFSSYRIVSAYGTVKGAPPLVTAIVGIRIRRKYVEILGAGEAVNEGEREREGGVVANITNAGTRCGQRASVLSTKLPSSSISIAGRVALPSKRSRIPSRSAPGRSNKSYSSFPEAKGRSA
jgi:hypothetical protein